MEKPVSRWDAVLGLGIVICLALLVAVVVYACNAPSAFEQCLAQWGVTPEDAPRNLLLECERATS